MLAAQTHNKTGVDQNASGTMADEDCHNMHLVCLSCRLEGTQSKNSWECLCKCLTACMLCSQAPRCMLATKPSWHSAAAQQWPAECGRRLYLNIRDSLPLRLPTTRRLLSTRVFSCRTGYGTDFGTVLTILLELGPGGNIFKPF